MKGSGQGESCDKAEMESEDSEIKNYLSSIHFDILIGD